MNFSTNAAPPVESESISRGRQGGKPADPECILYLRRRVDIRARQFLHQAGRSELLYGDRVGHAFAVGKMQIFLDRLAVSDVREVNKLAPMDAKFRPVRRWASIGKNSFHVVGAEIICKNQHPPGNASQLRESNLLFARATKHQGR